MERRDFIALCGVGVLLHACKTAFYAPTNYASNQLTVLKADVVGKNMFMVKSDKLQAPLCITFNNGAYVAALMYCTHKGCELNPAGNYLHCPCHGSEFTAQGKVVQGPADEDLKTYNVTSDNDNIYIHIQ